MLCMTRKVSKLNTLERCDKGSGFSEEIKLAIGVQKGGQKKC